MIVISSLPGCAATASGHKRPLGKRGAAAWAGSGVAGQSACFFSVPEQQLL